MSKDMDRRGLPFGLARSDNSGQVRLVRGDEAGCNITGTELLRLETESPAPAKGK